MKTGILHFDELPPRLKRLGYPNDIPVCEGSMFYEIDVREELLDRELIDKTKREEQEKRREDGLPPGNESLPMGFNLHSAEKHGGKIIWDDE